MSPWHSPAPVLAVPPASKGIDAHRPGAGGVGRIQESALAMRAALPMLRLANRSIC
jgi:hypothetical protein